MLPGSHAQFSSTKSDVPMASAIEENVTHFDETNMIEFADPSYFVFANRKEWMKQEGKITRGMAWKLFNDVDLNPKENPVLRPQEKLSTKAGDKLEWIEDKGQSIHFQDPWMGIQEIRKWNETKNVITVSDCATQGFISENDVSSFFMGY